MTTELSVSIAVMQEQLKAISEDMKEARESRKQQYLTLEKQNEMLMKIEHRLEKVEGFVSASEPTLAQWRTMQYKVQGAGLLGRWLYWLAGFTIGAAAALYGMYQKFWGH